MRIRSRQSAGACGPSARRRRLRSAPGLAADHLDALAPEDLVEAAAELRVAVVGEKAERLLVAELQHEVACLLGDPAPIRVGGTGDVLDPPRRDRDEEQDVDPPEERTLDGKEIAGEHARRL